MPPGLLARWNFGEWFVLLFSHALSVVVVMDLWAIDRMALPLFSNILVAAETYICKVQH